MSGNTFDLVEQVKQELSVRTMRGTVRVLAVMSFLILVVCTCLFFFLQCRELWPHFGAYKIWETEIRSIKLPEMKLFDLFTAWVAAFVFFFGLRQWREARHEASLKEYYQRLDLANKRMEAIYKFRQFKRSPYNEACLPIRLDSPNILKNGLPPEAMWIYTELDNLEYVIQKYQLGYVQRKLITRAMDYFYSLCRHDPLFAATAQAGVDPSSGSGYRELTQDVVNKIVSRAQLSSAAAIRRFRCARSRGSRLRFAIKT